MQEDLGGFEAGVFDVDGVLTDTASVHAAAWKRLFDDYLRRRAMETGTPFEEFTEDDYLEFVDGRPRYEGVACFLESRGIRLPGGHPDDPPGTGSAAELGNRKNELFLALLREQGVQRFDTSVALVRALRSRGVRTTVASSSRNCGAIIERAGISELFDARVDGLTLAELHLPGKPDPAMFLEAVRRVEVPPERAFVVEDAVSGVEAGRRGAFALVIGVDRQGQAQALRDHGADIVVRDLAELTVGGGR